MFQWLEKDFLGYLDEWDRAVCEREGFTPDEKKRMTLSQETLEGLRMTGTLLFWTILFILILLFCSLFLC